MNSARILLAAMTVVSTLALATPPQMIASPLRSLAEKRVHVQRLNAASLTTGDESGTVRFSYTITFSNSCVGASTTLTPLTLVDNIVDNVASENGIRQRFLKIAMQGEWKTRNACPMIYRPVTYRYQTIIRNLDAGERYDAEILGVTNGRSLEVIAGK